MPPHHPSFPVFSRAPLASDDEPGPRVAVVDGDQADREELAAALFEDGFEVVEHRRGRDVLADAKELAAVCLDVGAADDEILQRLLVENPDLPVVVLAADASTAAAVTAMRNGAYDFLPKPVDVDRLLQAVGRACERWALARFVRDHDGEKVGRRMVGESAAMRQVAQAIARVLESDATVCIHGESGTGKELVARAVHDRGHRREGPFVAINCAAVPSALHASELFGHERGAFTGAVQARAGRFEEAEGGTLFLDEVAEMSAETQAALLRTLQERTVRRVGGQREISVDARIVCATHRDLRAMVDAGTFRDDLFYRLMVFPIEVPPLRARRDDIPALVTAFLRELQPDVEQHVVRVHPDALDALVEYRWPGNVRELRNAVHRALLSTTTREIRLHDLPGEVRRAVLPTLSPETSDFMPPESHPMVDDEVLPLVEVERREIHKAMRVTNGHVGEAAKLLGIGRATLYRRLAKLEEE